MDRRRELAVLVALVGAVAVAAPTIAVGTIGATVESRVYMAERPTLAVLSRSTVPATFRFEPSGGWRVEPDILTLDPEQEGSVTIAGAGEDGATILIHVMPADPEPGMVAGEALLSVRVYRERPFDPTPLIAAGIVGLLLLCSAGFYLARRSRGNKSGRNIPPCGMVRIP